MINLGLQLLRVISILWIITIHTCPYPNSNELIKQIIYDRNYHVPSFTIISFYFSFNTISCGYIKKIKQRIERLLIPYIIIPIIIFVFNNILYKEFHINRFGGYLTFKNLLLQLIIGRDFHRIFWYQFNLIFITIFFIIIFFCFKNNFLIVLQVLAIIAYVFQYLKYNLYLFIRYNDNIRYSLGNII